MADENNIDTGPINQSLGEASDAASDAAKALKDLISQLTVHTKAEQAATAAANAAAEAARKRKEADDAAKAATDKFKSNLGSSVISISKTIDSADQSLSKWSGTINQLGSSFTDLAVATGKFGLGTQLLLGAFTSLTEGVLKQADNTVKAYNTVAKFGEGAQMTAGQIAEMGRSAGYSAANLEKFTKALTSLGPNIIALGGSVDAGTKKFAQLTKLDDWQQKQIDHFRKLGISQEEYTQGQADALQYFAKSGQVVEDVEKRQGGLRQATADYMDNLVKLSAMTGKSVDDLKKQQQEALANRQLQIYIAQQQKKAADLRAAGDEKGAKAIEDNVKGMGETLTRVKDQLSPEQFAALQRGMATGTLSGSGSAELMNLDPNIINKMNEIRSGKAKPEELEYELAKRTRDIETSPLGTGLMFSSDTALTRMGITEGGQQKATTIGTQDRDKYLAEQERARAKATDTSGKDKLMDLENKRKDAEISLGTAFDKARPVMWALSAALLAFKAGTILKVTGGGIAGAREGFATGGIKGGIKGALGGLLGGGGGGGVGDMGPAGKAIDTLGKPLQGPGGLGGEALAKYKELRAGGMSPAAAKANADKLGGFAGHVGKEAKVLEGLGKPLGGASDGIGKLAKTSESAGPGAGAGIEGLLKGLAEGLKAFGKAGPTVLQGAVYLGGAIVIIGAAIAGAAWLMGAGLKKLSEGLVGFGEVDGVNLLKVGLGLTALAVGMTAIAAGGIVAGLTNLVGKILGGGEDPLEALVSRLIKVQKSGLDGTKLKAQGDAIKAFAEGISSLRKSAAGSGSKDIIEILKEMSKLGNLSAAATALDKVTKLRSSGATAVGSDDGSDALTSSLKELKFSIDTLNGLIKKQTQDAGQGDDDGGGSSAAPAGGGGGGSTSFGGATRSSVKVVPNAPSAPTGSAAASPSGKETTGGAGKENGVKADVLSKKTQLEKMLGKKLTVTSGFRAGVANHGTGDAIDLGFGSNHLSDSERNQIFSAAIGMGFTGLGAEYRAPGGPHIHLDTSHRGIVGWGSDYTYRSLPQDSPYLAKLIADRRGGPKQMALGGITSGLSIAGEAGKEAVVPLPGGRAIPVEFKQQISAAKEAINGKAATAGVGLDMNRMMQDMANANKELVNTMKEGFQEMVTHLEKSNHLQDKLVKYSM